MVLVSDFQRIQHFVIGQAKKGVSVDFVLTKCTAVLVEY